MNLTFYEREGGSLQLLRHRAAAVDLQQGEQGIPIGFMLISRCGLEHAVGRLPLLDGPVAPECLPGLFLGEWVPLDIKDCRVCAVEAK